MKFISQWLILHHTIPTFDDPDFFKNIVRKEDNAGNQYFLLFPQCFLPYQKEESSFQQQLFCRLLMLSIWTSLKKLSFGKWLKRSENKQEGGYP